jgi:hypothetical protein
MGAYNCGTFIPFDRFFKRIITEFCSLVFQGTRFIAYMSGYGPLIHLLTLSFSSKINGYLYHQRVSPP